MFLLNKKSKSNNKDEKEIICNLIETYIDLANSGKTTLDNYISIIALIKMLQMQYKEYSEILDDFLNKFDENGIISEYNKAQNNIAKNIFNENNFLPNIDLAENRLYDFFPGCTDRGMHYLIIYGLCGKPIIPRQKYIMAKIFQGNYYSFYKQKRYYSLLSLNAPYKHPNISNKGDKILFENSNNYSRYKEIAIAYQKEKNDIKYEEYMLKAAQYNVGANEDLFRFYMRQKNFNKAKSCLNKLGFQYKDKKKQYDYYIKPLVEYYNYKINYPYLRKDILSMFNIDIKTFNKYSKFLRSNIDFYYKNGYSQNAVNYLKEKLLK